MPEKAADITGKYAILARKMHEELIGHSQNAKIVAPYLLEITNPIGLFRLNLGGAADVLEMSKEDFAVALNEICSVFGWIHNEATRYFYIPNYFKWNHPRNPNQMTYRMRFVDEISDMDLFAKWVTSSRSWISDKYRGALDAAIAAKEKKTSKTTPVPAKAPKTPKKKGPIFSDDVLRVFEYGVKIFKDLGHPVSKDKDRECEAVRRLIEIDQETPKEIIAVLAWLRTATNDPVPGNSWTGWGNAIKCFGGIRKRCKDGPTKYENAKAEMKKSAKKSKPLGSKFGEYQ